MRYALMTEPQQGMSYADQLAAAKRAEANGFDAYFRADHFASFPGQRASRARMRGPSSPDSLARPSASGLACSCRR